MAAEIVYFSGPHRDDDAPPDEVVPRILVRVGKSEYLRPIKLTEQELLQIMQASAQMLELFRRERIRREKRAE